MRQPQRETLVAQREGVVMAALIAAAEVGAPCPSNRELAQLVGFKSDNGPVGVLERLVLRGLITLERRSTARRVTIVATGRQTAPLPPRAPVLRGPRRVDDPNLSPDDVLALRVPDRTPCWRCGVRADVGCGHG